MKLIVKDSRYTIPEFDSGVYYIFKKNCIAQFSFGNKGTSETSEEARAKMEEWFSKRKDADSLRVSLIKRS
jgi:hypothetical protein